MLKPSSGVPVGPEYPDPQTPFPEPPYKEPGQDPGPPGPAPWHDPGPPVRKINLPPDSPSPGVPIDTPGPDTR